MTSSCVLDYLDGLPPESWYKLSTSLFVEELQEEKRQADEAVASSAIIAMLSGQKIGVVDGWQSG